MKLKNWLGILAGLLCLVLLGFGILVIVNEYHLDLQLRGDAFITLEYGELYTEAGAQASVYGTVFHREKEDLEVTVEGQVDTGRLGEYTVTYRAERYGVRASAERKIHVVDSVSPVLKLAGAGSLMLPLNISFEEPGYEAHDLCSGDLTDRVTRQGEPDPAVPGTYILTYTVSDGSGNLAQATRTVTYVDVIYPVVTLLGDRRIVLDQGGEYTDPGCQAYDDCDGNLTAAVEVTGLPDVNAPGEYTVRYTVSDGAGHTASAERQVIVRDTVPPVLTLLGDAVIEQPASEPYVDPGFLAMDPGCGDISDSVQITTNMYEGIPGYYTVEYTVTDGGGFTAKASRVVILQNPFPVSPGGVIYLTFDDGPSAYTGHLLDVLDAYGVKATFFVVGSSYYPSYMTRAAQAGHTVAMHSMTHDFDRIYASEDAFFDDLYRVQSLIREYTGQTSMLMRFPGGSSNGLSSFNQGIMTRLTKLVEEKGFHYIDWNVSSQDADTTTTAREVYQRVIEGVMWRNQSVVLMHDSYGRTPEVVERIILWGIYNGYTFKAMDLTSPGCHHPVYN